MCGTYSSLPTRIRGIVMIITFFGHRQLWKQTEIEERIEQAIKPYLNEPKVRVLIGCHGEFDRLALTVCRRLRKEHKNIEICVILTSLAMLQKGGFGFSPADYYDDVETMYYDIEEVHFKNRIVVTNRNMVDSSDVVICYVDFKRYGSGAKRAVNYAKRQKKTIINLYKEQDHPFYGMTREEIDQHFKDWKSKLKKDSRD